MQRMWVTRLMRRFAAMMFVIMALLSVVGVAALLLDTIIGSTPFYTTDTVFVATLVAGILYQLCRMREASAS